ncbi:ParB/RepB/Spo0J family partition protein [Candidatus Nomurabacteria bacterium]|nr:ParB/RepB/Spo0J family partition protein [Candidatus Nomurabacteria bacterium]
MSETYNSAIFWIGVDKIKPNPFQPRHEFDEDKLRALADSIRQYGVLQPLVVTRKEVEREDGGLAVEYELIAGERRWRASKIAGISAVPALIKDGIETDKMKLEMAIIENLQREDLNPVDRARAFHQLVNDFTLTHADVAKRVGKSREYVSNSIRLLGMPEEMIEALTAGKITEGHSRPILMLIDRPEEQRTLFQEIIQKRLTVRETESIARRIAFEKVRNKTYLVDPEIVELEQKLTEKLGTRVRVDRKEVGGKVTIDFFDNNDLAQILELLNGDKEKVVEENLVAPEGEMAEAPADDTIPDDPESELYNLKNFSL